MSRNKWSKESIIEKILELHQQSVSLNAIAVMENNVKLYGAARTHFGSWQNAINAAGLDYNEINHKIKEVSWSKDIIAAEIQKIANEGGSLRSDYVQKNNTKLHSAAQRYFNSWREAIEYAGFNYDNIKKIKWTKETVISSIRELHQNEDISSLNMQKNHMPLFQAGCRLFKSWAQAVEAAGIDYKTIKKQFEWDENIILRQIIDIYTKKGSCIVSDVLKENPSLYQAAKRHFPNKTWEDILRIAKQQIKD